MKERDPRVILSIVGIMLVLVSIILVTIVNTKDTITAEDVARDLFVFNDAVEFYTVNLDSLYSKVNDKSIIERLAISNEDNINNEYYDYRYLPTTIEVIYSDENIVHFKILNDKIDGASSFMLRIEKDEDDNVVEIFLYKVARSVL